MLIRPIDEWRLHGHWSAVSAKVHGIRGSDLLAQGRSPQQIAAALNEALGSGAVAWCDGGPYDAQWIQALFKAGGVKPAFAQGDWHRLASMLGGPVRERVLIGLEGRRRDIGRARTPRTSCSPWPMPWIWQFAPSRILPIAWPHWPHCKDPRDDARRYRVRALVPLIGL